MEINNKDIESVIESLINAQNNENYKLYKDIIDKTKIKSYHSVSDFYFGVIYKWERFINCFIKHKVKNDENIIFIYSNYMFLENHITHLISRYEGSSCCCDKSNTIINNLISFYLTSEKINFNYDDKYTYHLPKNILTNHDDIIEYYMALKSLFYGNSDKYIQFLSKLIKTV